MVTFNFSMVRIFSLPHQMMEATNNPLTTNFVWSKVISIYGRNDPNIASLLFCHSIKSSLSILEPFSIQNHEPFKFTLTLPCIGF
jgi:hypothetical protein